MLYRPLFLRPATIRSLYDKVTSSYFAGEWLMYDRYDALIFDMDGTLLDSEPTQRLVVDAVGVRLL